MHFTVYCLLLWHNGKEGCQLPEQSHCITSYNCTYVRYVEGLAEIVVRSGSDIARLQDQGNKVRRMAATDMNEHSSRYCIYMCECALVCVY